MARLVEVGPEKLPHEDTVTQQTDLSKLAFAQQQTIAHELYGTLIPLLHTAAMEGRSFINVTDQKTVKNIQRVADTFGQLLFHRHNVYKMNVTSADVTIYFLNSTLSHRAERLNEIWEDPLTSTIDEIRRRRRSQAGGGSENLPTAPQRHNPHAWRPPVLDP